MVIGLSGSVGYDLNNRNIQIPSAPSLHSFRIPRSSAPAPLPRRVLQPPFLCFLTLEVLTQLLLCPAFALAGKAECGAEMEDAAEASERQREQREQRRGRVHERERERERGQWQDRQQEGGHQGRAMTDKESNDEDGTLKKSGER